MESTKSEAKKWAREHYRWLHGVLSPSFTPNLRELDEEGISYDVRHNEGRHEGGGDSAP